MTRRSVLFELGTEELPAGEYGGMADALAQGVCDGLINHHLTFGDARVFATPRRLAVLITNVLDKAVDTEQEVLGPPIQAAQNSAGEWTPAAIGFARKQGISPEELATIATDKGERVGLLKTVQGAICTEVLPAIVTQAVDQIPISKRMRWGRERHEFLRPVQWLVLLHGEDVVDVSLFGLQSARDTRGHRFHAGNTVVLPSAESYEQRLREHYVIADVTERRALIRAQVAALVGADERAVIDEHLLDEVTGLVEWPVALRGSFDSAFLTVPRQALVSSMQEHQKYFHIESVEGELIPAFITVANIESSNPEAVIYGNEKVIRPRLADAAFFFDTDKQTSLVDKAERLKTVLFQRDLGTLADKQRRIARVAQALSADLGANDGIVSEVGQVLKADLVSDMVGEFPELQGIAGRHYALHDGLSPAAATAIEEHYWPKFSGDRLPSSPESAVMALADRLDTLVGIFGIGQTPTGSKDPFALRRASLAVIRMLLAFAPNTSLEAVLEEAKAAFEDGILEENTVAMVRSYLLDRLPALYEDQGISVDILRAVTAVGVESLGGINDRSLALAAFAGTESAAALAAANKRVANILAKTAAPVGQVDTALLTDGAEHALHGALCDVSQSLGVALEHGEFANALQHLASLRHPIDAFFDNVLVNADDEGVRMNRLALLNDLRTQFLKVADLAVLAR